MYWHDSVTTAAGEGPWQGLESRSSAQTGMPGLRGSLSARAMVESESTWGQRLVSGQA